MSTSTVEARTIRDLRDLQNYLDACLAATGVGEANAMTIHLATPIDMRLVETTLTDGSSVFDLHVAKW